MGHRLRVALLILKMTTVSIVVAGSGIYLLLRTAVEQQQARLEDMARSQARLIEAIARSSGNSKTALSTIIDAHKRLQGFGKTGEFILAARQGDNIIFLVSRRHYIEISDANIGSSIKGYYHNPKVVLWNSEQAKPMRRALSGESGTLVGLDYRGVMVLAAHEPVADLNWGIVAKIDLAEIEMPFAIASLYSFIGVVAIALFAAVLFFGMSNQLIKLLEKSEAENRAILETAAYCIITISDRGLIEWVNTAALEIFGYEAPEVIGKYFKMLIPSLYQEKPDPDLTPYLNTREKKRISTGHQVIGQRKNGILFQLELAVSSVVLDNQQMFILIGRDITQRKRTEQALQESYNLLEAIAEGTADGIFLKDLQGRYVKINSAGASAIGKSVEEIIGKDDTQLFPLETARQIMKSDRRITIEGKTQTLEEVITTFASPAPRTYLTTKSVYRSPQGTVIGLIGVSRDISDRVKAEAALREKNQQLSDALNELQRTQTQLIQTEKMSSLGQLVAGVAHEINNPVNFIYGNLTPASDYISDLLSLLDLYQHYYPDPAPEIQEYIRAIELDFLLSDLPKMLGSMKVGAERIREIVLSLRNFSRLDEAEMKPVDIHEGIDSTLLILQNRLKAKGDRPEIAIVKEYGKLPLVECYAGQLNQVFMNIIANAIDALEEQGSRGAVSPLVGAESPHPIREIRIRTEVLEGDRVAIGIADNGPGMTLKVRSRLFDPFFTTKPVGKGTGLGLSISYQIVVEKHGGRLKCVSEPGFGAEFWIEIPITQSLTSASEISVHLRSKSA